ncbi:protein of unknown function [Burkholderia multivorans]
MPAPATVLHSTSCIQGTGGKPGKSNTPERPTCFSGEWKMEYCCEGRTSGSGKLEIARDVGAVRRIGITMFNGFSLHEAVTIGQVLQSANASAASAGGGAALYEISLLSASGGMITSSSSESVWTRRIDAYRPAGTFHALFIVGGSGVHNALRDEGLVHWLRDTAPRCGLTLAVNDGRFLFEGAVPNQRIAHDIPDKRMCHRNGQFLDIRHGNAVDPLQAALHVIQRDLGDEMAKQIAANIAPSRDTQFTPIVRRNAALDISERIQASARWLAAHADRAVSIGEAAQVAAMSERNFLRRFKREIGIAPSDYLMSVRLDMCCRLLAETDSPIRVIALRCGFNGSGRLAKLFRQHLATTPTAYRLRNRALTKQPFGSLAGVGGRTTIDSGEGSQGAKGLWFSEIRRQGMVDAARHRIDRGTESSGAGTERSLESSATFR